MYRPLPSIGSKSCLWVVGWMYQVDVYLRIRRAVMVDGMSIREVSRVFGLHRDTVRKILAYSAPPGYRRQTPPRRPNPSTSSGGALHRRHRPNPGRRPRLTSSACVRPLRRITIDGPWASSKLTASQATSRRRFCLPSKKAHGRPIVRSPLGGGVFRLRYVPSHRLKTSLQGIYTCKCT